MIAIVIHRFDKSIVGGAEQYAYKLAEIISKYEDVEVITTTAFSHETWDEYFDEGVYKERNFTIRRFKVDIKRSEYWQKLHSLALKFNPSKLSSSFCIEWLKHQGPYSLGLFNYLKASAARKHIFVTYLYPTTFFGIDYVKNPIILSTYHDEFPFYFPVFKKYEDYPHLFLTEAEKNHALRHLNIKKYSVLGFGLDIPPKTTPLKEKFFLYVGRIEEGKNIKQLADFYSRFYAKYSIPLYIIGKGDVNLIKKDGIKYLGFVSEEEKHRYLKSAAALIHPSLNESLGIVLIESFANFSPAVVNKNSDVLFSHIRKSKAGEAYETYEEFENALLKILKNKDRYSQNAYRYYKDFYSSDAFEERIKKHIIQTP